jgi:hypothetical protein
MKLASLCAAALVALLSVSAARAASESQPDLAVGQMWSIKATPSTTAKVIIGRIEPWSDGLVAVSVTIIDVPTDKGPIAIGHAPFEKAALTHSLDRLLAAHAPLPAEFEEGYVQWKSARGGIFTIGVADAIAATLGVVKQAPSTASAGE